MRTHSLDPIDVRKTILAMLHKGKASHLGSSMSVVEMLIAVYRSMDVDSIYTKKQERSRVIVSKGHAAAALYAVMAHFGLIDFKLLETYCQDDSYLAGHVSHAVEFVEHSTGALGHGLSVACGCALGLRARGFDNSYVFSILGDGELHEGSIWESVMFAKHHDLSHLITLVDDNKISSITRTAEVIDMRPLRDRFAGFGLRVYEVNGNDSAAVLGAIDQVRNGSDVSVIICSTVKGYGVPFAENSPIWHYRSLGDRDYQVAIEYLAHLQGKPASVVF